MHETLTWLSVTIVGRAGRCMYSRAPRLHCVNSPAHVEAEFQLPGCARSCPAWGAAAWIGDSSPNGMCRRCSVSWLGSHSAPLSLSLRIPPLCPAQTPRYCRSWAPGLCAATCSARRTSQFFCKTCLWFLENFTRVSKTKTSGKVPLLWEGRSSFDVTLFYPCCAGVRRCGLGGRADKTRKGF